MNAYVSQIRPASSGFGQFERGEAVRAEGDWETVDEYAAAMALENPSIRAYGIDAEIAEMGDWDGEAIAAKLREVTGAVCGGHDTLVAYFLTDESVIVESVKLEADDDE